MINRFCKVTKGWFSCPRPVDCCTSNYLYSTKTLEYIETVGFRNKFLHWFCYSRDCKSFSCVPPVGSKIYNAHRYSRWSVQTLDSSPAVRQSAVIPLESVYCLDLSWNTNRAFSASQVCLFITLEFPSSASMRTQNPSKRSRLPSSGETERPWSCSFENHYDRSLIEQGSYCRLAYPSSLRDIIIAS